MANMRMSQDDWNRITPKNILHVGAHRCEERDFYNRAGAERVLWVEANPVIVADVAAEIPLIPGNHVLIQGLASHTPDMEVDFHLANNGQSSSMLEFGTHRKRHRKVHYVGQIRLVTTTIDIICNEHQITPDTLALDIQGSELMALRGALTQLAGPALRHIYLEVNFEHVYKECALIDEITTFLAPYGFAQVAVYRTKHGWGDALYSRPDDYDPTRDVH